MKIVALVGSMRKNSYNKHLVNTIAERNKDKFSVEILEIGDLPLYNQDNELQPPDVVVAFKKKVAEADAVLISTPEYNWSIPGVLKNALDWLSRVEQPMIGKPTIVVGASVAAMGTIRAQLHLRQILASPGLSAKVLPAAGNEVLVSFATQKFDENGQLTDEATITFVDGVVDRFLTWLKQ